MAKREAGWSAVGNPEAALSAFKAWENESKTDCKTLDVQSLILARDYAALNKKGDAVVEAINTDLQMATMNGPKSARITLTASGSRLTLFAMRRPDGTATTYIATTDVATKKTTRGMTEKHTTFEVAKTAVGKRAVEAEKLGWHRAARRSGFVAKPDAFSSIPTPSAIAKQVKK